MRLVHQFPEAVNISCPESGNRVNGALVFVNCMFRSFQLYRICDQAFVCFKVCRAQIPKRFNVKFPLESGESIGTFLTPVIVCGVNQAVFYFAVGDNDLCILKDDRGVYVLLSDIKVTQIHRAMRGELNTLMTDLTDGAFVGNGEVWTDCSPGSPEFETNSVDYVEAIVALPETRAKADFACREIPVIKQDLASLHRDVEELTDISRRLYDVSLNIVRTESNTLRIISNSQTTFDRFAPDGVTVTDADGAESNPPRGYQ